MSRAFTVAPCLLALEAQVDQLHPGRPIGSDGFIGDERHAREESDHNPNRFDVVTAWDITTAPWLDLLAEQLRALGAAGDKRVKYVIWRERITSAEHGWQWATYGPCPPKDPHTGHLHLSVSADPVTYRRTDPWLLGAAAAEHEETDVALSDADKQWISDQIERWAKAAHQDVVTVLRATDQPSLVSLDRKLGTVLSRLPAQ